MTVYEQGLLMGYPGLKISQRISCRAWKWHRCAGAWFLTGRNPDGRCAGSWFWSHVVLFPTLWLCGLQALSNRCAVIRFCFPCAGPDALCQEHEDAEIDEHHQHTPEIKRVVD